MRKRRGVGEASEDKEKKCGFSTIKRKGKEDSLGMKVKGGGRKTFCPSHPGRRTP